jgi:hypothetical protein
MGVSPEPPTSEAFATMSPGAGGFTGWTTDPGREEGKRWATSERGATSPELRLLSSTVRSARPRMSEAVRALLVFNVDVPVSDAPVSKVFSGWPPRERFK